MCSACGWDYDGGDGPETPAPSIVYLREVDGRYAKTDSFSKKPRLVSIEHLMESGRWANVYGCTFTTRRAVEIIEGAIAKGYARLAGYRIVEVKKLIDPKTIDRIRAMKEKLIAQAKERG